MKTPVRAAVVFSAMRFLIFCGYICGCQIGVQGRTQTCNPRGAARGPKANGCVSHSTTWTYHVVSSASVGTKSNPRNIAGHNRTKTVKDITQRIKGKSLLVENARAITPINPMPKYAGHGSHNHKKLIAESCNRKKMYFKINRSSR